MSVSSNGATDFKVGDRVKVMISARNLPILSTHTILAVHRVRGGVFVDLDCPRGNGWDASRFVLADVPTTPDTPKATFGERVANLMSPTGDGTIKPTSTPFMESIKPGTAKTSSTNPKDLIGITKVQVGLFPSAGTIEGARAMEDGAKKYGAYNWREHPVKRTIYLDAAERHLMALRDGEDNAEDSGVSHLGHILSCVAILADAKACGNLIDDRPTKGRASELFAAYKKVAA